MRPTRGIGLLEVVQGWASLISFRLCSEAMSVWGPRGPSPVNCPPWMAWVRTDTLIIFAGLSAFMLFLTELLVKHITAYFFFSHLHFLVKQDILKYFTWSSLVWVFVFLFPRISPRVRKKRKFCLRAKQVCVCIQSSFRLHSCDARLGVRWPLTCDTCKTCHPPCHGWTVSPQVLARKHVAGTPPWWSLSSARWACVWWPQGFWWLESSSFLCDQRKHTLVPSKLLVLLVCVQIVFQPESVFRDMFHSWLWASLLNFRNS